MLAESGILRQEVYGAQKAPVCWEIRKREPFWTGLRPIFTFCVQSQRS